MNIVSISVTKFSLRILRKQYGEGVIALNRQDILKATTQYKHYCYKIKEERVKSYLTERFEFYANRHDINGFKKAGLYAGHNLNRHHQHMMCTWILAQNITGINVSQSLDSFYAYYGISEDDYAMEAAYKYYQRYTREQGAQLMRIRNAAGKKNNYIRIAKRNNDQDSLIKVEGFIEEYQVPEDLKTAFKIRILLDASLKTQAEIGDMLNISNQALLKHLRGLSNFLLKKQLVRKGYGQLVNKLTN